MFGKRRSAYGRLNFIVLSSIISLFTASLTVEADYTGKTGHPHPSEKQTGFGIVGNKAVHDTEADLGKISVGTVVTSTSYFFVSGPPGYYFQIDSIVLDGPGRDDFNLTSQGCPGTKLVVPQTGTEQFCYWKFSFKPSKNGVRKVIAYVNGETPDGHVEKVLTFTAVGTEKSAHLASNQH